MSGKAKKQERKDEAKAIVQNDPNALYRSQLELVRLAGWVDGATAVLSGIEQGRNAGTEAIGVAKANLRTKQAEVEALTKAAKEAEKNGKPAAEAEAGAAA